ncbi:MAG TPA: precorrin-2 C(20)-methyltransferase [Geobacteraceae bacterium]|nr:precorrin-2 C(20)-methyltransferase [Geobacteraceae bacterium]
MARVYAVGVGPGDPELLTRKAEIILRRVPVICAPSATRDDSSYALSIVESLIDRSRQEVVVQVFPMRKNQEGLEEFWEKAAGETAGMVRDGKDVAFITIGDPFLYSTFLYIYRILREKYPDVTVEAVPGITSINAAAIAAGVPLAAASERLAVIPAAFEEKELRHIFQEFDTIVLMKVNRVFDRVFALLKELGLEKKAAFIRRVGSADQEVVFELESLLGKKLDYLSLLIVKK